MSENFKKILGFLMASNIKFAMFPYNPTKNSEYIRYFIYGYREIGEPSHPIRIWEYMDDEEETIFYPCGDTPLDITYLNSKVLNPNFEMVTAQIERQEKKFPNNKIHF